MVERALVPPGKTLEGTLDEAESPLDRVLKAVDTPVARAGAEERDLPGSSHTGLSVVRLLAVEGREALIARLDSETSHETCVQLHETIDSQFAQMAAEDGQLALVQGAGRHCRLVGIVQTKAPRRLTIEAEELELSGTKKLTLKSGRAALQLRADGAIEILGSRISATSRGVFRILGRALRLN